MQEVEGVDVKWKEERKEERKGEGREEEREEGRKGGNVFPIHG